MSFVAIAVLLCCETQNRTVGSSCTTYFSCNGLAIVGIFEATAVVGVSNVHENSVMGKIVLNGDYQILSSKILFS